MRHLLYESRVNQSAKYILRVPLEVEVMLKEKLNTIFIEAANKVGRVELQGMQSWPREKYELIPIN